MDEKPKQKNEKPSSNYREEVPKGSVPADDQVVKKTEDEVYHADEPEFKNPAKRKELGEQPVHPIKKAPRD
ncbi:hypothetical protein [Pedobacter faecalis]|uniref:hypothetical protein n=1 Tax=Pedobacter faecalis TaxID=3041495 RepID=UPI00255103F7|nr:hypothetical protein [Pedobacter sp. ELA7]